MRTTCEEISSGNIPFYPRSLLNENVRNYPADDSFKGSRQLCELLRGRSGAGPVAIFGPSTPTVANHVEESQPSNFKDTTKLSCEAFLFATFLPYFLHTHNRNVHCLSHLSMILQHRSSSTGLMAVLCSFI